MNTKFITKSLLLTTALAIMLLLSMPSSAGLVEADNAYSNKDYKTALKEYLPFAKKGDYEAQLKVGLIYFNGLGTPQNFKQGIQWLTKSAESGNPLALGRLGTIYADGKAVNKNYFLAYLYFNLAEANKSMYPEFAEQLKVIITARDQTAELLTPSELELAQAYATHWKVGLHLPSNDEVK